MPPPESSRSLIFACAMSRATTSVPFSSSRVLIGYRDTVARISFIGWRGSLDNASPPRSSRVVGPADHDREVIRRARRGPERADLGVEKRAQPVGVQDRLGLLVQVALVGRAAALGHEQEVILVAVVGVELDLCRQVGAGV